MIMNVATMKTPDTTAETMVMAGETFLLPLSSSPKSFARLPRYTYSSVPEEDSSTFSQQGWKGQPANSADTCKQEAARQAAGCRQHRHIRNKGPCLE